MLINNILQYLPSYYVTRAAEIHTYIVEVRKLFPKENLKSLNCSISFSKSSICFINMNGPFAVTHAICSNGTGNCKCKTYEQKVVSNCALITSWMFLLLEKQILLTFQICNCFF